MQIFSIICIFSIIGKGVASKIGSCFAIIYSKAFKAGGSLALKYKSLAKPFK